MAKIILTHEVSNLGSAGDVVEVKDGYARNYLFPRGFATQWSKGAERQIESIKAARAARELASLEDAQALAASLTSATVTVPAKAGAGEGLHEVVVAGTTRYVGFESVFLGKPVEDLAECAPSADPRFAGQLRP